MVNLTFPVRGREGGIRPEFQPVAGSIRAFDHSLIGEQKSVREHAHHLIASGAVLLLLLMPVLLHLGVLQQVVQAVNLGLFLLRGKGLPVLFEQPATSPSLVSKIS